MTPLSLRAASTFRSHAANRGQEPSPDYSLVTSIEERALQSEGNGPVPWSGLQTEFLERTPGKDASAEPSTKDGAELFVSVPSLLQAHSSIDRVS